MIKVQVRYQEKDAATWEAWVDLAANATTYTVTNLENRKTYTFAVRAVNRIGDGEAATVMLDRSCRLRSPDQSERGGERYRGEFELGFTDQFE